MKNLLKTPKNISMLVMVAFIATAAMFNACSKQESAVNPVTEQQLSSQDLKINNTIKNFRDKVTYLRENPGYKSGESYTLHELLFNKIPGEDVPAGYCIESEIEMSGIPASEGGYQRYFHFGIFQFGLKVNYELGNEPIDL